MTAHVSILPNELLDTVRQQLGDDASSSHLKFMTLPHPRTGIPCLFLPYTPRGSVKETILEVQSISPRAGRSWFLTEGEVIAEGNILMMTPVDPVFLLIPFLQAASQIEEVGQIFRTQDDIIEAAAAKLTALQSPDIAATETLQISPAELIAFGNLKCIYTSMSRVCEFKDVSPELRVFRYSRERFLNYLAKKAERLNTQDTLEKSRALLRELAKDGLMDEGKEALLEDGRKKLACDLLSQYIPSDIYADLLARYDFTALEAHVQRMQADALQVAMPTIGRSGKGSSNDEDVDEKKRKATAQKSRGVEKLKKANIKGMSKLSTFFTKKPAVPA